MALATQRLPQYASHFWVANAWKWMPPRQFRSVDSLYDCVAVELLSEYSRRLLTRYVEPGGPLIMGAYGSSSKQEAARAIAQDVAAAGFRVAGSSSRGALPVARVAWLKAEQGPGADAQERAAQAQRSPLASLGEMRELSNELLFPLRSAPGRTRSSNSAPPGHCSTRAFGGLKLVALERASHAHR